MKTVSWILLAVVALLLILGSLTSAAVAYFASPSTDMITPQTSLEDLNLGEEVTGAMRARRGTAASFAVAFGTLLFLTAVGPYRKGDVWAWWSILISTGVLAVGALLRMPALGETQGIGTAVSIFGVALLALLLDFGRLKRA